MRRHLRTLALLAAALAPVASGAQTIAITGGRVFPVSGDPIDDGTVLIRDGRIVAVGADVAVPADAQRIDATGKWVTPGLFNAATRLGLVEVGAVAETRNASARSTDEDRVNAAFRVWEGLNPLSVLFAAARNEGVTTVGVRPQGGFFAGQSAVIDIVDGTVDDMVVRGPVAMALSVGNQGAGVGARGEFWQRVRELLDDVRAYRSNRALYDRGEGRALAASRSDLEALIPVIEGRMLLAVEADAAADIETALGIARDYGMRIAIVGGSDAWRVADRLAAARVPVIAGAMNNIPDSWSQLGARQENPGLLRRAGVAVSLLGTGNDPDAQNVRNIRQEAGNAVAYGMSWTDALRAVTLAPAELYGVADHVGSLQPGRTANVVVWSGDPFEFNTVPEHVIVHGREMNSPSRQDMLMERYKTLPPVYKRP